MSLLAILTVAALPRDAEAQRRAVARRPSATRSRVVYVAARPYYRVYYSPFYAGWYGAGWYGAGWHGAGWYGWPRWYGSGFYGQYYPPYGSWHHYAGSARIDVRPREAEVYVDGYLVGTVDDFDGWLQRLHVEPGAHEVQIFLPGHRTLREKILFRPGATVRIAGALEPLPAGAPDEPRPTPGEGADPNARVRTYPRGYPPEQNVPRERDADPRRDQPSAESFGAVAIRVQPGDAEVVIDGDRWEAPPAGERLVVQLAEGEHRVEIRRTGYRTYSTAIRVRRGDTVPLNVSLSREHDDESEALPTRTSTVARAGR